MTEALRALGVLAEPPCAEHAAIAEALELPPPPGADEHMAVLGFQLPPYASIYLGAEGMLGGEARDRIAGFWRALGGQPPREPDHLSVLCAALADLADLGRPASSPGTRDAGRGAAGPRCAGAASGTALVEPDGGRPRLGDGRVAVPSLATSADPRIHTVRGAFYREHIASWMPPYLAAVRRIGSPFYVAWANTLDAVLAAETTASGPPSGLPLALRAAAAPDGPPADLDALLGTVLAPVRIGMVITRDDLVRCADAVGLGLRAGERRFALRALLGQDAGEVLGWLAGEARQQAAAYGERSEIARWWHERAGAGARWLAGLARDAAAPQATAG